MATTKYICQACGAKSTRAAAKAWDFFPSTRICRACYEKGRAEDHRKWCFGKTDTTGKKPSDARFGYDPDRFECGTVCPDRLLCPLFIVKPHRVKGRRVKASKIQIYKYLKREQEV